MSPGSADLPHLSHFWYVARAMEILSRLLLATLLQLGLTWPATGLIRRRYGGRSAHRFAIGTASTLLLQQGATGMLIGRRGHRLTPVDLMTLSRGLAASLLCGLIASGIRDRGGRAGWMGWLSILYGAILCDWLDGPIARLLGTTETGAILDREADSWLTLCAAGSAAAWGELPVHVAAAPLLRYVLLVHGLRSRSHAALHQDEPSWARQVGILQMMLFIAATAPFRGPVTSGAVHLLAPAQTPVQIGAALTIHRRRMRA
jgi:phosphatidylglycerophosphate synthase